MKRPTSISRHLLPALLVLTTRASADSNHAASDQLAADAAALAPAFVAAAAAPADPTGKGMWGSVLAWTPHIPVTAASLPDGRLLTFASNQRTTFPSGPEFTYAAVWNPATGVFTEINNPRHDMFCGGVVTLPDGRVVVSGGRNISPLASIFDYRTNQWSALPNMNDPRWYNTSVALTDGTVFTASGSGGSNTVELWNAASGWRRLPGIDWSAVTSQPGYINIWNPFLLLAPNGKLLHFGPTQRMNWVDPTGSGTLAASGQTVPGTQYPKEGAWAMYDEGKILVTGGGANTTANPNDTSTGTSTTSTYTIDLNAATPVVQPAAAMQFARQFANSVILPSGEVMIIGGNTSGLKFNDTGSILTPELWNPRTGAWRTLADMAVPRNYHSVALLLPDGRVWSGGGGLGGNSADHQDAQIFTPPALLNADGSPAARPLLDSAPAKIGLGAKFPVTGTSGLAKFAFIKMSATTHCVNTDLRYLELPFTESAPGSYTVTARGNGSVLTPGYWMLFGLTPSGVYSVSKVIQVSADGAPIIFTPGDQIAQQGAAVNLQIQASTPANGTAAYTATGLPPGLSINPATGLIGGTPTTSGAYLTTVLVTSSAGPTASTAFNWSILLPVLGRGSMLREWWVNIPGVAVTDLTNNATYPTKPTGTDTLSSFETPSDAGDNYGQRVRGFVYAPSSGPYRFWIAGDDESQLFLSTTPNPANATLIARVPGWSSARDWTKYAAQTSALITLVAGQRYYIEARMKEGTGRDNLAVAWQPPGAAAPAVIPGAALAPYQAYLNPLATWSCDEKQWSGAAGEVRESTGLLPNLSGTSLGGATTSDTAPALAGNPGTGRSGRFNGSNQYVQIAGQAAVQSNDFTVAAWVKVDQATAPNWRGLVGARERSGNELHGFNLDASPDGRWTIITGGQWSVLFGPAIVANQWTHVAATFRATSVNNGTATGTRCLYVNGQLAAQDTGTYTPVAGAATPLYIGASDAANGTVGQVTEYCAGNIDEVRIHAAPLSAADLLLTMNLRHMVNQLPVVTPVGDQNHALGANIALNISATDAEGDPLVFTATGLPPGLAMSASGGVITGTPTTPGSYNVVVSVNDGSGSASAAFIWTIQQALTVQPLSGAIVALGSGVALNAQASGGTGAQFTWNFGDGTPDSAWSSSPATTHLFPAPGRYIVTLTARDSTGRVVTSSFYQGIAAPLTARPPTASSSLAYEPRGAGNARLWVVNPDSDTVSVFDAVTRGKLAETAVAASPRTVAVAPDGRVWVVCAEGAAISILNSSTFAVAQTVTLPRGSRPFGLAFDPTGAAAWLTLENAGRVLRLNPATGAETARLEAGLNVRHLSVSADGARVYVSRFLTPRLSGEETAAITTTNQGGQVLVIDTAALSIVRTLILQHSEEPDTTISGRGIPNYLGAPVISPDGRSAWVPSKQDNIKRGKLRNGVDLTHESAVRAIASRLDLATQTEDRNSRVDFDNAGVPSAACFDPAGIYAFVALEASRAVAVIDVWNAVEVVRFPAGRAPQGLTLSPDGKTLFVQNFMDRTVTVHDVSAILGGGESAAPTVAILSGVAAEKLAAKVLLGKQLFYDAKDNRLALQEYLSCAACHNDGDGDGRVWDFTGFGEGLRNTIALRGHGGTAQGPLHWSGNFDEGQDFDNQIHNFAGGTGLITSGPPNAPLGAPNAGRSADLDALASYLQSLTVTGSSPARSDAVSFSAAAGAGRAVFLAQNCASCHGGPQLTNSALNVFADIGTLKASSGQRLGAPLPGLDVPTLRGLWATAPYLHDGSAATLADAVKAHRNVALSATDLTNLVAFLASLDDDAAAPQQIADAGFEAPKLSTGYLYNPTGSVWTFSAASGVTANDSGFTQLNPPAPGGAQVLFLQNVGSVQQAVTLAAGSYRVRLAGAQRGNANTGPQTVVITVDGAEVGRFAPAGAAYTSFETSAFPVAAGARLIRLAGLGKNADGSASADSTAFLDDLQIVPSNSAPTIAAVAAQSSERGKAASLQIVASDPDGQALACMATGLPTGLSINAASGLIAGTIAANAAAANAVTVTVSDGVLSATVSFTWATTAAPGSTPAFADDFSGGALDAAKWTTGSLYGQNFAPVDAAITVLQQNGRLEITPRANTSTEGYRGVISVGAINLRGGSLSAQVTPATGGADTWLALVAGSNALVIGHEGAQLWLEQMVNGVRDYLLVTYTAASQRYWRIRHDSVTDRVVFELSPDGAAWTVARSLARGFVLDSLRVELAAGTYQAESAPGVAIFDNVLFTPASVVANRMPILSNPGAQTIVAGQPVTLQIVASDPDSQALTFSASGLPAGLAINSASGLITGTVSAAAAATNSVVVTASDGALATSASFAWSVTLSSSSLPAAWTSNDLGKPGVAGRATFAGGVYTIAGSGSDIGGTTDQGQFAWQTFVGNGEFIARIPTQTNTNAAAKAGVMFRETLQANARLGFMLVTPGKGLIFEARTTTGGAATQLAVAQPAPPNLWVRLIRNGDTVAGFRSADGVTWSQVGIATVPMSVAINAGLAVTSRSNSVASTATFDNVRSVPSTLPAPWIATDIGAPPLAEIERVAAGVYTISGGGAGLAGASDQFHSVAQTLTGDGEIIARVTAQAGTATAGRAGVILRESTAVDARMVALSLTPASGTVFQTRTTVGGLATTVTAARNPAPNNWLRLVRAGQLFTAYRSSNGTAWTVIGTATIPMSSTIQIGLAVTAQNKAQLGSGTFDNVRILGNP